MDLTIPVGAPAVPLQVTIGATAYTVVLHDNGDNTYLLRLEAADGTYTDLLGAPCAVGIAAAAIPKNRLVKGHTDGTLLVGTLASKRIIGANAGDAAAAANAPVQISAGYVSVVAAEPLTAGDLIKCGDNGRVLQMADADNVDTIIGTGTAGNFANQPADDGVTIVSTSADDDSQTATIIGTTNGSDTVVVEEIALNGTTDADSTKVDWGVILAVKLDAACVGTVEVSETSGGLAIVSLTAGQTSKGVVEVAAAAQGAHGLIPYIKAAAASTKQVGMLYETTAGADAYDSNALNGTSAVAMNAAANRVQELYLGDVATGTVATMYTNATQDDELVCVGRVVESIAAEATGLAYIRP